jgi:hypothetical protein
LKIINYGKMWKKLPDKTEVGKNYRNIGVGFSFPLHVEKRKPYFHIKHEP